MLWRWQQFMKWVGEAWNDWFQSAKGVQEKQPSMNNTGLHYRDIINRTRPRGNGEDGKTHGRSWIRLITITGYTYVISLSWFGYRIFGFFSRFSHEHDITWWCDNQAMCHIVIWYYCIYECMTVTYCKPEFGLWVAGCDPSTSHVDSFESAHFSAPATTRSTIFCKAT